MIIFTYMYHESGWDHLYGTLWGPTWQWNLLPSWLITRGQILSCPSIIPFLNLPKTILNKLPLFSIFKDINHIKNHIKTISNLHFSILNHIKPPFFPHAFPTLGPAGLCGSGATGAIQLPQILGSRQAGYIYILYIYIK